jgi:hypothetical protein
VIGKADAGNYMHGLTELEGNEGGSFWEAAVMGDDEEDEEEEDEIDGELGEDEEDDEDLVGVEGGCEIYTRALHVACRMPAQ